MNNDCRDEFNRFMYGDEEPTTRFDVQNEVKQHWKTWQAAWAVATKAAIRNQGEPVKGAYFDGVGVVLCGIGSEKGQRLYKGGEL